MAMFQKLCIALALTCALAGCGKTTQGDLQTTSVAAGDICAAGGLQVTSAGSTFVICNGVDGTTPSVSEEPTGTNCAAGGIRVEIGGTTRYVCNGTATLTVTPEAPGSSCTSGGLRIDTASGTSYVCNGIDGNTAVTVTPRDPGSNECQTGGVSVSWNSGNSNICNGIAGATPSITPVDPGSDCQNGGLALTTAAGTTYVCNGIKGVDGVNGTSVTVTPLGLGPSCPAGGLQITDANGASVVCNGISVSVVSVGPGDKCQYGGLAVTGVNGTEYVCHGNPTPRNDGLCPTYTNANYSKDVGIYAVINGATQADFPGGPTPDAVYPKALRLLATCHTLTSVTQSGPQPTGKRSYEPYYLVLKLDESATNFIAALKNKENLQVGIHHYDAPTTEVFKVELGGARVLEVGIIGLPDPDHPGTTARYLRVALRFATITMTWLDGGVTFSDTTGLDPNSTDAYTFSETIPVDDCIPTSSVYPRHFLTLSGQQSGTIAGDVTASGEEGSIEVLGFCHSLAMLRAIGSGVAEGRLVIDSFVIVKRVDTASPKIWNAVKLNEQLQFSLRLQQLTDAQQEEKVYTITGAQAFVVGVEQFVSNGARYERVTLVAISISYIAAKTNASVSFSQNPQP